MIYEAGSAFLYVHLDHMQPKSWSQDYTITSRSAIWLQIWTVKEPELTAKVPRKCSFQDRWLKDSAYQECVLKDKHYTRGMACKIQLIFLCS